MDYLPERREQRHSDIVLTELNTRFNDFAERYERDIAISTEWKKETTDRLRIHCEFVKRVSPVYQRMMWLFAITTTSIIGVLVVAFFKHIHWQ